MKYITTILLSMIMLFSCSPQSVDTDIPSLPEAAISLKQAETIYDYAYPLVIMKISQDVMFTVPLRSKGQPNKFIHFKRLAGPKNRAVVLANRNTQYSVGWLDLKNGPVVFEIPDVGDRYFVMPLLDAWTNTFASLGSRTTGQGPQKYLISNADWSGDIPLGLTHIISPTNTVWITGRIQTDSPAESDIVAELQDGFTLKTYAGYAGEAVKTKPYKPAFKAIKVRKPVPYSLKMSAAKYYETFFSMWAANPGPDADQPMLEIMAQAGITPGAAKFADLPEPTQAVLKQALKQKQAAYQEAFYEGSAQTTPWTFNLDPDMGDWKTDYARRAYWCMWGLGTNITKDAVYGVTQLDQDMQALEGQHVYRLRFAPDKLPPTRAFWSVTLYDNEGYLEANTYDRHSLGSNHKLSYNPDGSLDIFLSHENNDEFENWIPAPKDKFKILLRIYWPKQTVLNGEWSLPDVEKIEL